MSVNDMHGFGNSLPSEPRGDAILEPSTRSRSLEEASLKYDRRSLLDTRLFGDYTTTREIQRSIVISILNLLIVMLSIIGKEGESRFHEIISTQFGTL